VHLLETHERQGVQLLACIPRDILWQVRAQATFQAVDARFSPRSIDAAWRAYFGALTTAHS
jgi:hypothetical protein